MSHNRTLSQYYGNVELMSDYPDSMINIILNNEARYLTKFDINIKSIIKSYVAYKCKACNNIVYIREIRHKCMICVIKEMEHNTLYYSN